MQCETRQPPTVPLYSPTGHDVSSGLGLVGGQDQSQHQQHRQQPRLPEPERESQIFSVLDPTPALAPDITTEDDIPSSRLHDPESLVTEARPLHAHPRTPHQESHLNHHPSHPHGGIEIAQPSASSLHAQTPWLRLDDSELDGLLDAIDGEASMELATPLMPTSLLVDDFSGSDLARDHDHDHEYVRNEEENRDQSGGDAEMILESLENLERLSGLDRRSEESGLVHENQRGNEQECEENWDRGEEEGEKGGGGGLYADDVGMSLEEQHFLGDDLPDGLPQASLRPKGGGGEGSDVGDDGDGDNDRGNAGDDAVQHEHHYTRQERHHEDEGEGTLPQSSSRTGNRGAPTPDPGSLASPRVYVRSLSHTEEVRIELERAGRELAAAQEMLERGDEALRDVEAKLVSDSLDSRRGVISPDSPCPLSPRRGKVG